MRIRRGRTLTNILILIGLLFIAAAGIVSWETPTASYAANHP